MRRSTLLVVLLGGLPLFAQEDPEDRVMLESFVQELGSPDFETREEAEEQIRAIGLAALDVLEAHREDGDLEVQERVARLIHLVRQDDFILRMSSADVDIRWLAYEELPEAERWPLMKSRVSPGLVPILTDVVLYDVDGLDRREAVLLMGEIGTSNTFPGLLWAIRDPDDGLTHGQQASENEAVGVLGRVGDPSVLPELDHLQGLGYGAAGMAASRIRARFPGAPIPIPTFQPIELTAFLEALGKLAPRERIRGIRAILTGGARSAEESERVALLLSDIDSAVRFEATRFFTFRTNGPSDRLALRLGDVHELLGTREMAALALGKKLPAELVMGATGDRFEAGEAGRALIAALEDPSPALRRTVVQALSGYGATAIPLLESMLTKETDAAVRTELERTLETLRLR